MRIYLDWNATTPPLPAVLDAMRDAGASAWGNPSSVHGDGRAAAKLVEEARAAIAEGADYLLLGAIFETATHPGQPGLGLDTLRSIVALGVPVIAIGGITPERAQSVKDAGAWGVAAMRSLWHVPDSYAATMAMLAPWTDGVQAGD